MVAQSKLGRKYKLNISLPDQRDRYYSIPNEILFKELPPVVDLRPGCPPVRDQGQVGACTAFACTGMLGYDRISQGLPAFAYSELYLYWKTRLKEGTSSIDAGATIKDTIQTALKIGVCAEELWPYLPANVTKRPTKKCDQSAAQHKADGYMRVPQNLLHMKSLLYSKSTFNAGISVYESFESDVAIKTGMVPMPAADEQFLGGHALLICGYTDEKRCFLAQNSWGTSTGDQGYLYLPYEMLERHDLASDLWTIKTAA